MKLSNHKQEEIPALVGRNGAKVEAVNRELLKTTGIPFSGAGMAKGDTVEMPETWEDVQIQRVEVRPNSNSWDYRILVVKNGKLDWVSLGFLNRTDKDRKPVHPVAEALNPMHDNDERVGFLLGKTILAPETITYQRQKFDNEGRVVAVEFDEVTTPKLIFKE